MLARDCDTDNLIVDSLIISAHGLLAGRLREMHPDYEFEEFDLADSQQYLERHRTENGRWPNLETGERKWN